MVLSLPLLWHIKFRDRTGVECECVTDKQLPSWWMKKCVEVVVGICLEDTTGLWKLNAKSHDAPSQDEKRKTKLKINFISKSGSKLQFMTQESAHGRFVFSFHSPRNFSRQLCSHFDHPMHASPGCRLTGLSQLLSDRLSVTDGRALWLITIG